MGGGEIPLHSFIGSEEFLFDCIVLQFVDNS